MLGFYYVSDFSEGLAMVVKDGKWGYINTKYEQIVECKFDNACGFNEGFAMVQKDGKYGYINTKCEQIVECKFDKIWYFKDGFARVEKDGKSYKINTSGNFIVLDEYKNELEISKEFDEVNDFSGGWASVKKDGKYYKVNTSGNIIFYDENENLIEVLNKAIDRSNNTFFLSRLDDKFGLLDENFNVVVKNSIYGKFEVLQRINETTFLIKIAGRELFVDSEGNFR